MKATSIPSNSRSNSSQDSADFPANVHAIPFADGAARPAPKRLHMFTPRQNRDIPFNYLIYAAVFSFDTAIITISSFIAYRMIYAGEFFTPSVYGVVAVAIIFYLYFMVSFKYCSIANYSDVRISITDVLKCFTMSVVCIIVIGYLTKTGYVYSRLWGGVWIVLSTSLLIVSRLVLARLLRAAVSQGVLGPSAAVIILGGAADQVERLQKQLKHSGQFMPRVAAVFSDTVQNVTFRDDAPSELVAPYTIYPSAGIFTWLTNNHVDSLILFVPEEMLTWEESDCWKLIKQLQCLPVDVDCIFGEIRKSWISNDVFLIGNYLATRLGTRPLSTLDLLKKRMLDIVISVFLLPFVLTLTAIVAILIKVDSPGPIFFRQPRQGFKGQEFNILKFRTMYERSNAITEFEQAQKNDPRTTRVGKWLRRTSIDELPQIFNVLRGDMTLVGPRPHAIQHDVYYRKLISDYAARHRIKPGITGWAQVNGLRGPTSDVTMRQRIELDLYYVDNWSIMFDLKILLSTVRAVFRADAF